MNSIPSVIPVAVVEDDRNVREAMIALLSAAEGIAFRGVFGTAEEAIEALPDIQPDVVLMDIQLPGITGIECVRKLKNLLPDTDFIMLSVLEDEESVFRALGAGATGYLQKHASPDEILNAIRDVRNGGAVISPGIARLVVRSFQPKSEPGLSDRESEVLAKLCEGENYRSIADVLFISANTVKAHIKNIYTKLHVNTRAEAVKLATRDRLV